MCWKSNVLIHGQIPFLQVMVGTVTLLYSSGYFTMDHGKGGIIMDDALH